MPTIISGLNGIDTIQDNVVTTADIQNGAITGAKLSGGQSATVPVYGAVAWANFNGALTGTNAPRAGGNVTSVVRNGVGDYTVNFTTALPDANYAVVGTSIMRAGDAALGLFMLSTATTQTSSLFRLKTFNAGGTLEDFSVVTFAVFR